MNFVKEAHTPETVERISIEATVLKSIVHPNVVEVLGVSVTADSASLTMADVPSVPLADAELDIEAYANVIMSAAATLSFVHSHGVTHNSINANHILVRKSETTAVLCGFGDATFSFDEFGQSQDVAALGYLLRDRIVIRLDPLRARLNDTELSTDTQLKLASVATSASDGQLTALGLADALRRALDVQSNSRKIAKRRFPWRAVSALVIPLLSVVLGVALITSHHDKAGAVSTQAAPKHCTTTVGGVDTNGDGCPNDIQILDGVVSVDGARYAVGSPGDVMAVGNWLGDGHATLALLRPSNGQFYVFTGWPSLNNPATPAYVTTVIGATTFTAASSNNHDVAQISAPEGPTVVDALSILKNGPTQ